MLHVTVQYRCNLGRAENRLFAELKKNIRAQIVSELTTPQVKLKEPDFSFTFQEEKPPDELSRDLQLIILADSHEFRTAKALRLKEPDFPDKLAISIGKAAAQAIYSSGAAIEQKVSLSVSLFIGDYAGYWTHSIPPLGVSVDAKLLAQPISALSLKTGTNNVLQRQEFETVGELWTWMHANKPIPGIGRKSREEILRSFATMGFNPP